MNRIAALPATTWLLALLLGAVVAAFVDAQEPAWRWPMENATVLENYPGNTPFPPERLGEPPVIHGMRLTSDEGSVYPVGPGRPVYILDSPAGGINNFSQTLGGVVALEHRAGLRSIYAHVSPEPPYGADAGRPLGSLDGSGIQLGRSLFLGMYDAREEQSLNPRLVLPERQDRFRPVVSELRLYATGSGALLWSSNLASGAVADGTVRIIAYVYDRQSFDDRYKPYRVTIFANGAQAGDRVWDARGSWREHGAPPEGSSRVTRVEAPSVTLVDGENRIEVVAEDFRGNVEERSFTLFRRPP